MSREILMTTTTKSLSMTRSDSCESIQTEKTEACSCVSSLLSISKKSLDNFPLFLTSKGFRDSIDEQFKVLSELISSSLSRIHKTETQRESNRKEIPFTKKQVEETHLALCLSVLLLSAEALDALSQFKYEKVLTNLRNKNISLLSNIYSHLQKMDSTNLLQTSKVDIVPSEDLMETFKTLIPASKEVCLDLYFLMKRRYILRPSKKTSSDLGSEAISFILNKFELSYETKKKKTEEKFFELLAKQSSRSYENQRFVMTEKKEMKMALNEVLRAVDKMGEGRMHNQSAVKTKMGKEEKVEQAEKLMMLMERSCSQLDNQRYALSQEKIQSLSLNELINTVEKLVSQRMENQDAINPEEKKKEMISVIADVVEKMKASSMDDQRFIQRMAPKINMTTRELNLSIDSVSSCDTTPLLN